MDEFDDDDIDYFGEGEEDHDSDDDDVRDNGSPVPEDIAIFMDRGLMGGRFRPDGSYLGRGGLASDVGTNAYREINGAADGHPGWFVDRYDKWLLVRNDNDEGNGVGDDNVVDLEEDDKSASPLLPPALLPPPPLYCWS